MEKIPTEITPCTLDCLVMPNGEIISAGRALGRFEFFSEFLTEKKIVKK